jgi:hypothetical protein
MDRACSTKGDIIGKSRRKDIVRPRCRCVDDIIKCKINVS